MKKVGLLLLSIATLVSLLLYLYDRQLRDRAEDIRQHDRDRGQVDPGLDLSEYDDEERE